MLLLIVVLFFCSGIYAKEKFYPVFEMPIDLLKNANSVVRKSETILEVFSPEKIKYTRKEVVTILNKNGDSDGVLWVSYDPRKSIDIETANFYDKNGNLIKKVKKSEIYDLSYFDGFSLYRDGRFKRITPQIKDYPYTVEYEFSVNYKGAVDYPDWMPCNGYGQSVEYAGFDVKVYDNSEIRVKSKNIEAVVDGEMADGIKSYSWKLENMPVFEYEPYAISYRNFMPNVSVAPSIFSYCEVVGNMATWKDFGRWAWGLIKDKTVLPEERVSFLRELTDNKKDTLDKIRAVYVFLQEKTRYVNVQLGIGGFEPFSAEKVDETGYGDCKALTNYMRAMLQSIGIKSYYTLVYAGHNTGDVDSGFSAQEFNHVILAVPLVGDTIFLECTDKYSPCGFLGSFTDDRYALLVDKDNSRLVRTTSYGMDDNTWGLNASVDLKETGEAIINDTVTLRGLQYESVEKELRKIKDKQIENEYESSDIAGARYLDIAYAEKRERVPSVCRIRAIDVARLGTKMGNRMFVPVNILNQRTSVPKKVKDRKYPFQLGMSYMDDDTVTVKIPDGYEIEYLPEPVKVESVFGRYTATIRQEGESILFFRHHEKQEGVYPPEKYADYVLFVKQIVDADRRKIVLKKM